MLLRSILLLSILLIGTASISQKNLKLEAIFQLEQETFEVQGLNSDSAQKMAFGLTSAQINEIYKLTNGRVNFKNIYRVKMNNPSQAKLYSLMNGFTGVTDSTVPPPVIAGSQKSPANLDPEYQGQWWVRDINAEDISEEATGKNIIVADCDAGFFWDASDLEKNMLYDLRYDFADKDDPYTIDDGGFPSHGTSVTAIIAGVLDGHGTNGLAHDAKIVPLQNFNYSGKDDINKEEATTQCVLHAIQIPNISIIVLENQTRRGSSETFLGTRNAVRLAIESGIPVVSAAGNYSAELIAEKNDDTGSIIVGAIEPDGSTASFSNFGERISVAAFGRKVWTLQTRDGQMADFGGTSSATPQVVGAVALMLEVNPELTPFQIRQILENTRVEESKSTRVGGRLDIREAVNAAKNTQSDKKGLNKSREFRQALSAIL